jgi:hypothetical protein
MYTWVAHNEGKRPREAHRLAEAQEVVVKHPEPPADLNNLSK